MSSPHSTPIQHHQQLAQSSRRDNSSISSTHSRGSTSERERERERGSRSANGHPPVESAVTKLLVSIKLLLEALTHWSTLRMTEAQVSDVYVRLGNDFNAAVAAFRSFNIEMSELLSVPDDLRAVLEQCLSEDATPANLEIYLPTVRQIITSLLQGLRNKQQIYRRIVSDRRHRIPDSQGSERDSRSSRSSRTDSTSSSAGASRSNRSRSGVPSEGNSVRGSLSEAQRRMASNRPRDTTQPLPSISQSEENHSIPPSLQGKPPEFDVLRTPGHRREHSHSTSTPSRPPTDFRESARPRSTTPVPFADADNDTTITMVPKDVEASSLPRNIVRYSLTDNPVPAVVVDGASRPQSPNSPSGPGSPLSDSRPSIAMNMESTSESAASMDLVQAPVMESSLAALKKSDTLERRASKRFSIYNISKMTGAGFKERLGVGRSANRRSIAVDPSSLTATELRVLTEEDETTQQSNGSTLYPDDSSSLRRTRSQTLKEEVPPIPPLPDAAKSAGYNVPNSGVKDKQTELAAKDTTSSPIPDATSDESEQASSNTLTVFLQVGREVKKATMEKGISFSSLRVIFVDKFSYNPGQDNFPNVYIRDPSSGVMYELEDMEEVKDKCLLSLNIDPLDQIKQHIDQQLSSLTHELKELQRTVGSKPLPQLSRQPTIVTQPFTENESVVSRPSDKQFQSIARRISRFVTSSESSNHIHLNGIAPQSTGSTLQPQSTGGSVLSEFSGRIVADLKTQFDEVQNLRRDLGIMRQTYLDFVSQTKESLNALRSQTQSVRQLSTAKIAGAREYINAGKVSLDTRTQNVLTRVEEMQDTVETLKDDVLKRSVNPRSNVVKTVAKDIAEVSAELESLRGYIATVRPMWKKTWEEELQNIVEEQQFLTHQEEFLQDLLEDHKALSEVFGHVEKVISIRGSNSGRSKAFKVLPPPEDKDTGLSTVMMEIRNASVDPEKRMKAIAANQRNRQKELASRSDEFEDELKGFVKGQRLKRTGGTEEAERVRQKRNDLALKSLFSTSQSTASNESTNATSTSFTEVPNSEMPASPAN